MVHVALIGAGNIGSRWLQGLEPIAATLDHVTVVEPDPSAREVAADTVETWTRRPTLATCTSVSEMPDTPIDVLVVATSSVVRRRVVDEVFDYVSCRHLILEKFLFPGLDDYTGLGDRFTDAGTQAWVNTPRRAWQGYRELASQLQGSDWVDLRVHGGDRFPLGTTAIHFLDTWAWLLRDGQPQLDGSDVIPELAPSRRPGTIELHGVITGAARGRSRLEIGSRPAATIPLMVEVLSPDSRWLIDEARGTVRHETATGVDNRAFGTAFQSTITAEVVTSLLERDTCALPTYEESAPLHEALLRAVLPAYRSAVGDDRTNLVPIT